MSTMTMSGKFGHITLSFSNIEVVNYTLGKVNIKLYLYKVVCIMQVGRFVHCSMCSICTILTFCSIFFYTLLVLASTAELNWNKYETDHAEFFTMTV